MTNSVHRPSRSRALLGAFALAVAGTGLLPGPARAAAFGPAPERLADISAAGRGVVLGGHLYFAAVDTTHGVELWRTDGTRAGTRIVRDIRIGDSSASPTELVVLRGRLYFTADDGVHGRELWSSDGTSAGTRIVRNIGDADASSTPSDLTVAGNRLFFTADATSSGRELWFSDGSGAGTLLAIDMRPGPDDGEIGPLTAFGSRVAFGAERTDGVSKPWISGGDELTTHRLDDWSDATTLNVGEFAALRDRLVFAAGDANSGQELWASRGVPGDAEGLRDIQVGPVTSSPTGLTRFGDEVVFQADRSSDGTELWTTDGTAGGTQQLREIRDGFRGSDPAGFTAVGTAYFTFTADDGVNGSELWVSRGTPGTTRMLQNIGGGERAGVPAGTPTTAVAGRLFFAGDDGNGGTEPWLTDGTPDGTHRIADQTPGSPSSSPAAVGVLGSTVVYANEAGTGGLWGYTVTSSRTVAVPRASYPVKLAARRKVVVPVRVVAPGATGSVTLTRAGRAVGRAAVVNGIARVRVTVRLAKGRHRLVAAYSGSPAARASVSAPFTVRIR